MRTKQQEIEAMTIICNIQMMQTKIKGTQDAYKDFNNFSIEDLREFQDSCITKYNATF